MGDTANTGTCTGFASTVNDAKEGDESERVVLLQSLFRGLRSRRVHGARAKAGCKVICPFAESSSRVVDDVIRIANVKSSDSFFDLGCGNGAILTSVAMRTGASCTGVDVDTVLCESAIRRAKDAGVGHLVTIEVADLETFDFSSATVIYMFLVPSCLKFMSTRLQHFYGKPVNATTTAAAEVQVEEDKRVFPSGRRTIKIICYMFPLPEDEGWKPVLEATTQDVINVNNPDSSARIFLYNL